MVDWHWDRSRSHTIAGVSSVDKEKHLSSATKHQYQTIVSKQESKLPRKQAVVFAVENHHPEKNGGGRVEMTKRRLFP